MVVIRMSNKMRHDFDASSFISEEAASRFTQVSKHVVLNGRKVEFEELRKEDFDLTVYLNAEYDKATEMPPTPIHDPAAAAGASSSSRPSPSLQEVLDAILDMDTQYQPRQAIKGQALADFIVECTHSSKVGENKQAEWLLFVDGASGLQGSGTGIVLVSPEGETLEYSLRFAFSSTNNVAEYEALIAEMRIARKLEVTRLVVHSDSQLIVQQFQGQYETREQIMAQYLHKVKDLAQTFQSFQLTQINISLNGHADALSKLASTREITGGAVFVEMLHQPSIEEKEMIHKKQKDLRCGLQGLPS
ncbi:uncharacterized protein LOC127811074 [Diospyros lotus]|uniref:uncharacterized protein LOC127811074 n=1 Tax=Diospyros lotus TaxID=55363 RepID=UPI00224D4F19|nr:uncharacterized protein LOC127811074 [Diospyros lotus]